MDKVKKYKDFRSKYENIGVITGILDKNNNYLISGDKIKIKNKYENDYIGRIFYHKDLKCFGLFMGCWYGEKDEYDPRCYGKFIKIPNDNGMKMEIEKIQEV